jgi:ribosomal protein S18 acetylase RimI-like enzyme
MKDYELEFDEGYIKAYVVNNTEKNIKELFSTESDNLLEGMINMSINNFLYIEEIYIYSEFRRQGFATRLFSDFVSSIEDEELPIVLIAGSDHTPNTMDIVKFYENFGFDILFDDQERMVMIR